MKLYLFASLLLLLSAVFSAGCERIVDSNDIPYRNQIVVRGILNAGKPIDTISITHTLPLNVSYDISQAIVPDAQVFLTVDGVRSQLIYTGFSLYKTSPPIIAESGKSYQLDVEWNGLKAASTTRVPFAPTIDSFSVTSTSYDTSFSTYVNHDSLGNPKTIFDTFTSITVQFHAAVHPNSNAEIYSGIEFEYAYDSGSPGFNYYNVPHLYKSTDSIINGDIQMYGRLFKYGTAVDTSNHYQHAFAVVRSYDVPYYDFYLTYQASRNRSDFGSGGSNPKWNVTGDGIGLFIGTAETKRKLN